MLALISITISAITSTTTTRRGTGAVKVQGGMGAGGGVGLGLGVHIPLVSAQSHAPHYYGSLFYGVSGLVAEEVIIGTIKTVPLIIRSGRHVTLPYIELGGRGEEVRGVDVLYEYRYYF